MKRVSFLSIGSCGYKTEKGTLFLSILLSLKTIGKGVKFQHMTPIRATFTNTIAHGINCNVISNCVMALMLMPSLLMALTVFNCVKSNYAHFIRNYFSLIFALIIAILFS